MPMYTLDQRGKSSLYEYLYRCLREDIRSGRLAGGTRLPSKRDMARDHGIAVVTVENAYAQLLAEGYVISRPRSGFYVAEGLAETQEEADAEGTEADAGRQAGDGRAAGRGETFSPDGPDHESDLMQPTDERTERSHRRERASKGTYGRAFDELFSAMEKKDAAAEEREESKGRSDDWGGEAGEPEKPKEWFIDFTSGHIHHDAFPFATWSRLVRRLLTDHEADFLTAPPMQGVPELLRAIADYLRDSRRIHVDPECIFVGPGTDFLNWVLLEILASTRTVAVEDPGYTRIGRLYETSGRKCSHIPVDRQGIRVDLLRESGATLVHTSPSHHFPTGCIMSAERRMQLLQWARERDAYIVEDDYDSEFRYTGRPIPTLTEMDDKRVIYTNTFTRTLAPSIRIAYMVLPKRLTELLKTKLGYFSGSVSSLEQYTMAAYLSEGYYQRHISRMRNFYRTRRQQVIDAFRASPLRKAATLEEDFAGLHFVLSIHKDVDDKKLIKDLELYAVKINPIALYCYGNAGEYQHKFLLNYGSLDPDRLPECFERMARALKGGEERESGTNYV